MKKFKKIDQFLKEENVSIKKFVGLIKCSLPKMGDTLNGENNCVEKFFSNNTVGFFINSQEYVYRAPKPFDIANAKEAFLWAQEKGGRLPTIEEIALLRNKKTEILQSYLNRYPSADSADRKRYNLFFTEDGALHAVNHSVPESVEKEEALALCIIKAEGIKLALKESQVATEKQVNLLKYAKLLQEFQNVDLVEYYKYSTEK